MLISTVNITHSAPERTWNAPPETDDACIAASTCTTTMIVKSSVGIAREPRSVSTSGIGPARETYSVTLRSSAGAARYMSERPVGSTPCGSSAASHSWAVRPASGRSGARSHSGRSTNSRSCARGMRQRQTGVGTDRVLVPDQVEVERARSPAHVPHAAVRRLDREEDVEQRVGVELGVERGDGVQERRLVGEPDRIRPVERRGVRYPPGPVREIRGRRAQRRSRISQVAPESDVRSTHPLGCISHISP